MRGEFFVIGDVRPILQVRTLLVARQNAEEKGVEAKLVKSRNTGYLT
jgi:hypothetical protein